jgi:hypothetical protein
MAPIKLWYNILVSLEYWLAAGHFSSHRLEQYHTAYSEDQLSAVKQIRGVEAIDTSID